MSMTYTNADAMLQGRCKDRRKVANNTYLERRDNNKIALRLHNTDILIFEPSGVIEYQTGGWKTPTTKQRLNEFGPLRIWSDRGVWYCGTTYHEWLKMDGSGVVYVYQDGMRYQRVMVGEEQEGWELHGAGTDPSQEKKTHRRVVKYCKGYLDALIAGKVGAPGPGDCMPCQMRVADGPDTGKTLGEVGFIKDHIESHIEESYYVPSLLHRAMEVGPTSHSMWWWLGAWWDPRATEQQKELMKTNTRFERPRVEKVLRKYVLGQMGMVR